MERKGELLRESEWMRVYRTDRGDLRYESKFLTEGLRVSAASLRARWDELRSEEQLEFAQAFSAKPDWSAEDEELLDFLTEVRSAEIWSSIALLLVRYSDKRKAVELLLQFVEQTSESRASFYQALAYLQDQQAVPALRRIYESYQEQLLSEGSSKLPARFLFDYLCCCRALVSLDHSPRYLDALEQMLDHPNPQVRGWAEMMRRETAQPWPW